jgi:SsrA-binding protein
VRYSSGMDYARNPKAFHEYEILETLEAGLVLRGHEVKSIKAGRGRIQGAYVRIIGNEAWLVGANIPPYQPANTPEEYREQADRRLLLSKRQLATLSGLQQAHGTTLIPLRLYDKKGLVKIEIAVARGKKKYDKRESIKKKDVARSRQRGTSEE